MRGRVCEDHTIARMAPRRFVDGLDATC